LEEVIHSFDAATMTWLAHSSGAVAG
jgi:hypothetical protein